jgi:SAM-dependent methyltransferase/uncharacterized protein YbaR (Trm112 family)
MRIARWFLDNLVCPRDKLDLTLNSGTLVCHQGHHYPVVEGIPIMLLEDVRQTHGVATYSLEQARYSSEHASIPDQCYSGSGLIDSFVQKIISATNGMMYRSLINSLDEYPIPDLRIGQGNGELFLDVGCNWGRWCVAAYRKGFYPIGIDPSLEALLSAVRVAKQLNVQAHYLVGDARFLPFRDGFFDFTFSYSVMQHFDKRDARVSLREVNRVLKQNGRSMIQMPNAIGIRCLYHQMKRGFREGKDFEVRYWTPAELKSSFAALIGPSELSVDGFFSLNAQKSEAHLLPWRFRIVVSMSDWLRRLAGKVDCMTNLADSLYVVSQK